MSLVQVEETEMTATWHSLNPEQQRAEWARYHAAQQPVPSPVRSRRPVWPWLLGAVAAVAVLAVAVVAVASGTTTINGQMTVFDSTSAVFSTDGSCVTYGGFREIAQGTTVTVRDAAGAIVATGALEQGRANGASCVFSYSIPGVPTDDFYSVEVAARGPLTYSADEVAAGNVRQELRSMY